MSAYISSYDREAKTPDVGSKWVWGRKKAEWYPFGAKEYVRVTEVKWNGEEWWVRTAGPSGEFWNDLSVFREGVRPDMRPMGE